MAAATAARTPPPNDGSDGPADPEPVGSKSSCTPTINWLTCAFFSRYCNAFRAFVRKNRRRARFPPQDSGGERICLMQLRLLPRFRGGEIKHIHRFFRTRQIARVVTEGWIYLAIGMYFIVHRVVLLRRFQIFFLAFHTSHAIWK